MNVPLLPRQRIVYIGLALISILLFAGMELGVAGAHPGKRASALVAFIAFVKARYVILDFMELRGTRIMRSFDVWLLACCAVCISLILK